jgi:glycosyltransferase involved in cell wall biosynthesis
MTNHMPEFSVLIPTRNRRISALLAIRSALAERNVDLEVIVADNSDQPIDRVFDDERLRILPPEDRALSMPANWERAVRAARGEWLIVLSDKCRLVPGALATLRRAVGGEYAAVTYCRTYFFQDLSASQTENAETLWQTPGSLRRPPLPFTRTAQDSKEVMKAWLKRADYVDGYRPMLYCTLVHRGIVDNVLKKHSSFFFGLAPDVASGLSVLGETKTYLDTNLPATITQFPTKTLSGWSNGFAMAVGKDLGKRFLAEFGRDPFASHGLPPTGSAVVMQTLLDYLELRGPDLPSGSRIGWLHFALVAAHEIERYPIEVRNRLQLQLLRALSANDRTAAWIQIKSVIVSRLPRLYELYRRARNQSAPAASAGQGPNRDLWSGENATQSETPSLAEALAALGRDVATPSWS